MRAILSERGVAFSVNEYVARYGNQAFLHLQKQFTVRTVDKMTKIPQVTKLYALIKCGAMKVIELPRFAKDGLMALSTPSARAPITHLDINLPVHEPIDRIAYTGRSNPNQQIVVAHVMDRVAREPISGITLKLAAGCGKSYVAMDVIGKLRLKTLVVVPNTYLLDQWMTILTEYFPTATIGTLYGKRKQDGDIIIGIINTVAELQAFEVAEKMPLPTVGKTIKYITVPRTIAVDDLFATVGLTVFDESQMYVSKEFRKVFRRIHSRYTIGLSATPDIREDKLDTIHQLWLGSIVDAETLPGYNPTTFSFESEAHLIEYHARDEHCTFGVREDGMIDYASIMESLIKDPNRNTLIIDQVIKLMTAGLYTFVFSDRRNHLEHLYGLLEARCKELGMASAIEMPEAMRSTILYGGAKEETIETAKTLSTVVLTTYAYSAVGVSITKMNALVLSTPRRSNMTQIINRVFRLGSDQSIKRIIVDICDAKMPIKQQVRERIKAYEERGSVIVRSSVNA